MILQARSIIIVKTVKKYISSPRPKINKRIALLLLLLLFLICILLFGLAVSSTVLLKLVNAKREIIKITNLLNFQL